MQCVSVYLSAYTHSCVPVCARTCSVCIVFVGVCLPVLLMQYHYNIFSGADLGFSERGANHSSGSLKQGVWGCSPPEAIGFFVL